MSLQSPNLRELLNDASLQTLPDALRQLLVGDVLGLIIGSLTPTEAAAAVTSNAKTLSNPAGVLLDVVATAGGSTGRKAILVGGASVVPVAGQVVWDGASSVRFAAADAVTAANFLYTNGSAPLTPSFLARSLGERD